MHRRADGRLGQLDPGAQAGAGQAVPDADRGRVLDLGSRDGGDGACGAGEGAHRGRGRDRGDQADDEDGRDRGGDVPASLG